MTSPSNTYTEIVNKREAEYVSTLSYEQFFKLFPPEDKGDNGEWDNLDKKEYYSLVQLYIVKQIKNNFELEITYKPSAKNPTGRIYAKCPMALQRIHKPLREFLTKGLYHDYDMINCHFVIFKYLCDEAGLPTVYIKNYIENRPRILADNKACKTHILAKLNSDNARSSGDWNKELKLLIKECNENKKVLYKKFVSQFQQSNEKNPISSIINKKMCQIENNILQEIITEFPDNKIVPCFDGLLIDEPLEVYSLPDDICKWAEKPIETNVVVPDDFTFIPDDEVVKENQYEEMKKEFEKRHAKIINKSTFILITNDGEVLFKSKADMVISYEHMNFQKYVDKGDYGYYQKQSFIKNWLEDDNISRYDDIDCYPETTLCPTNIFNTWTGFAVQKMKHCEMNQEHVNVFLKHILILCDNDLEQQKLILLWFSHIFKYPEGKSFNPVFISGEGSGKGTLMKIISRLVGVNKYLETTDPLMYVFGQFNDPMTESIVVNINECRKKDMIEVVEKLKGLVADPMIWINGKNTKKFKMRSFHRFITTTNNEDPIPTKDKDRRNHIIRCSDELQGKDVYFGKLNRLIKDDEFIYSIYLYLLTLDPPENFNPAKFPKTEYHQDLQEAYRDYAELWLEDFVSDWFKNNPVPGGSPAPLPPCAGGALTPLPTTVKKLSSEVFRSYRDFIDENKIKCDKNCPGFIKHLKCLKFEGIKSFKSGSIRGLEIDMEYLGKKYMIGCQIKIM